MADNTIIERLVAELGFEVNDKNLKKFNSSLDATKNAFRTIAAVATVAVSSMAAFTRSAGQEGTALARLSNKANISTSNYQVLANATRLAGEQVGSLDKALISVTEKSQDLIEGIVNKDATEGFGLLGINVKDAQGVLKQSDKLIAEISQKLSNGRSEAEQRVIFGKLGIDDDFGIFLAKGTENLNEFIKLAETTTFVFSEEDIKNSELLTKSLDKSYQSLVSLKNALGVTFAEDLSNIANAFSSVVNRMREFVEANPEKTVQALTAAVSGLAIMLGVTLVSNLSKLLKKLSPVTVVLTSLIAGLSILYNSSLFSAKTELEAIDTKIKNTSDFISGANQRLNSPIIPNTPVGVVERERVNAEIKNATEKLQRFNLEKQMILDRNKNDQIILERIEAYDNNKSLEALNRYQSTQNTNNVNNDSKLSVTNNISITPSSTQDIDPDEIGNAIGNSVVTALDNRRANINLESNVEK